MNVSFVMVVMWVLLVMKASGCTVCYVSSVWYVDSGLFVMRAPLCVFCMFCHF